MTHPKRKRTPKVGFETTDFKTAALSVTAPYPAPCGAAAQRKIPPVERFPLGGQLGILRTIQNTGVDASRRRLNPSIQFEGIVLSRCNLRTNLYRTTRTNVEKAFQGEIRVFKTAIPETVKVGDAISRGLTVMEYAPDSKASIAYRAFAKELISYAESAPAQRGTLHGLPGGGACRAGGRLVPDQRRTDWR